MSTSTLSITPDLLHYLQTNSVHEHPMLKQLRHDTEAEFEAAPMQTSPEQGQLFTLLFQLLGVKQALEIGTFTGYSSICMAMALPDDGHLTCCDSSPDWTRLAKDYWQKMGLTDKITLHLQPALKTLAELLEQGKQDSFDFAFIDADKGNYLQYYEYCLKLTRPGGLIAIDNVLWGGAVLDASDQTESTQVIRELNQHVYQDDRVVAAMVPIGDGLTLVTKR